jgi:hypothetical protein
MKCQRFWIILQGSELISGQIIKNKKNWDSGFMPFDYWFSFSEECVSLLKKHGHTMRKNSKVFSDQLFYGYTALFVNDRIVKYASHSGSEKFKQAVELIYT